MLCCTADGRLCTSQTCRQEAQSTRRILQQVDFEDLTLMVVTASEMRMPQALLSAHCCLPTPENTFPVYRCESLQNNYLDFHTPHHTRATRFSSHICACELADRLDGVAVVALNVLHHTITQMDSRTILDLISLHRRSTELQLLSAAEPCPELRSEFPNWSELCPTRSPWQ